MIARIRKIIVKSLGLIVNPVICLYPGNRPITDRPGCKTNRWNQITDNLPASRRNLPMPNRPIIVRPIRGIVRSTKRPGSCSS